MPEKSLRAFIVRPFGTKKDRNQNEVNFDAVQEQLIVPALERVGVDGRTTLDILRAGNIRVDMFQRLLTADLVDSPLVATDGCLAIRDVVVDPARMASAAAATEVTDAWQLRLREVRDSVAEALRA